MKEFIHTPIFKAELDDDYYFDIQLNDEVVIYGIIYIVKSRTYEVIDRGTEERFCVKTIVYDVEPIKE